MMGMMSQKNRTNQDGKIFKGLLAVLALSLTLTSGCAGLLDSTKPTQQATIKITPSSLNFGNVAVGKKVSRSLSVKNIGTTTLNITAASLSSTKFTLSGITFPFSLVAGSTANLTVSFGAGTAAGVNGMLTLKTDAGSVSASVALTAMATPVGPQLSATQSSVSFGSVTTGTKDSSTVTLINSGSSDLKISAITANGASFGVSGVTTPLTIGPGQSTTLTATYSPTSTGSESGSISITSNDPASPATIGLSGTGTATSIGKLTMNPASLFFGNVTVGKNSVLSSTITNSGQATVHISAVSAPGSGFTGTGLAAGTTIAAGQSASLQVRFAPTTAGTANSSISITSDASGSLAPLSLSGTGVAGTPPPKVSITTPVAGSSVSGTVIVTASASAAVGISSVQFQIDGSSVGAPSTTVPYSTALNTTTLVNGGHILTAVATDTANNKTASAPVSINILNSLPNQPAVSIASPLAGTTVSKTITVTATASDNKGIASVQFQVDGSNLGNALTSSPYSRSWDTTGVTEGAHILTAVATSNDGTQQPATASTVVIVNNSGSGPVLSATPGWHKIPSTAICGGPENDTLSVPDNFPNNLIGSYASYGYNFATNCGGAFEDSSTATVDTSRNRIIFWQGGHNEYNNEVYSFEANNIGTASPVVFRLDDPAPPTYVSCPASGPPNTTQPSRCRYNSGGILVVAEVFAACSYAPGCSPTTISSGSRHTYDNLAYMAATDQLYSYGGGSSPQGFSVGTTWLLNMNSVLASCAPASNNPAGCDPVWTNPTPSPSPQASNFNMVNWDPNTNLVWGLYNGTSIQSYDPVANVYANHGNVSVSGYHNYSALDPYHKKIVTVGSDGISYIDISNPASTTMTYVTPTTSGCSLALNGFGGSNAQYPGVVYDPIDRKIVVYPNGGNQLVILDPTTWTCALESYGSTQERGYPHNTPIVGGQQGTFGHFQYIPAYDIFVLCNDPSQDCWYLRRNR